MRIKIITYGCTSNKADSELMAGLLTQAGHELVDEKPDLIIINTCVVKQPTERKILKKLDSLRGMMVIVAGCLPQSMPELANKYPDFSFIGVDQCLNIVDYVKQGRLVNINRLIEPKLGKPLVNSNPIISIIPIAQGCLSECNYCIAKLARGNLHSYSKDLIINQMKKSNVKEYWFTSQDNGCYGLDINSSISELIEEAVKVNGDFMIRLGMMNPKFALKDLNRIVKSFKNPKLFKFIHLPVQSGSDKVLKSMNRGYSVNGFKDVINAFRSEIPKITVSTDIICGYPGETEDDFNKTLELIEWLKPDVLNISRFWPRPGTKAAGLKQVNGRITKERSTLLTNKFDQLVNNKNKSWVGWQGRALIDEVKSDFLIARNDYYKPILVREGCLGDKVSLKITGSRTHYLIGKII